MVSYLQFAGLADSPFPAQRDPQLPQTIRGMTHVKDLSVPSLYYVGIAPKNRNG